MEYVELSENDGPRFDKLVLNIPSVVFIYMPGCGHCDAMHDDWRALKSLASKPPLQDYRGNIIKLHSHAKTKSPCTRNISGYPMVMSVRGGEKMQEFSGDRNTSNFVEFITKSLDKRNSKTQGGGGRKRKTHHRRRKRNRKHSRRKERLSRKCRDGGKTPRRRRRR
jgi:hypothetical protein